MSPDEKNPVNEVVYRKKVYFPIATLLLTAYLKNNGEKIFLDKIFEVKIGSLKTGAVKKLNHCCKLKLEEKRNV